MQQSLTILNARNGILTQMIIFYLTLLSRNLCKGGENLDSVKIFTNIHREAGYLSKKIVFKMKNGGKDNQTVSEI